MDVSIIVPMFNEEGSLPHLYAAIVSAMAPAVYLRTQHRRGRGIAMLASVQRSAGAGDPGAGPSLAWGEPGETGGVWGRRLRAFWKKGVGPFDAGNFHSIRAFGVFWLGEKFEAAGYLRGVWESRKFG